MEIRPDLLEVLARRALTEDAARPDAVDARHAGGGRTARENIADLVDQGSFVEYGERERTVQETTATYQEHAKALNAARLFEIDDVIDPAETRAVIAATLAPALGVRSTHG